MKFPSHLPINTDSPASQMLANGDITVAVSNTLTGGILHVRFRAVLDNRPGVDGNRVNSNTRKNWLRVPLENATHVFLEIPSSPGEYPTKVGTYYTLTSAFFPDKNASEEVIQAGIEAATWLTGENVDDRLFTVEGPKVIPKSPFMVTKILTEISTLCDEDQDKIRRELQMWTRIAAR